MSLLVRFVVAPECEGLGAQRAGDGPAAAEVLAVLVSPEVRALGVGTAKGTSRVRGNCWKKRNCCDVIDVYKTTLGPSNVSLLSFNQIKEYTTVGQTKHSPKDVL